MEQQIFSSVGLLEFHVNEVGLRLQSWISKILPGASSSSSEGLESLDPDVEAIRDHMEEFSDDEIVN